MAGSFGVKYNFELDVVDEQSIQINNSQLKFINEMDKKLITDQLIRQHFINRLNQLPNTYNINKLTEYFCETAIRLTLEGYCTPNLPFVLLVLSFECCFFSDYFIRLIEYLEIITEKLKNEPFFTSGKHHLLRLCNDILKRLSKQRNTMICGRIQLLLCRIFPPDELSAINLTGDFNNDNTVTLDFDSDSNDYSSILPDYSALSQNGFYDRFWSIQDVFVNPTPYLSDSINWIKFTKAVNETLEIFSNHRQDCFSLHNYPNNLNMEQSNLSNESASSCPKYLTGRRLFHFLLLDRSFQCKFIIQLLIFCGFIKYQYKLSLPINVQKPSKLRFSTSHSIGEQHDWAVSVESNLLDFLNSTQTSNCTQSLPTEYFNILTHLLSREHVWIDWKNQGCPRFTSLSFKKNQNSESNDSMESEEIDYMEYDYSSVVNLGHQELTRLWKNSVDNFEACLLTAPTRSIPSLKVFFPEYYNKTLEELSTSTTVETNNPYEENNNNSESIENIKTKVTNVLSNDSCFQWRALRLMSRKDPHFFSANYTSKSISDLIESSFNTYL